MPASAQEIDELARRDGVVFGAEEGRDLGEFHRRKKQVRKTEQKPGKVLRQQERLAEPGIDLVEDLAHHGAACSGYPVEPLVMLSALAGLEELLAVHPTLPHSGDEVEVEGLTNVGQRDDSPAAVGAMDRRGDDQPVAERVEGFPHLPPLWGREVDAELRGLRGAQGWNLPLPLRADRGSRVVAVDRLGKLADGVEPELRS